MAGACARDQNEVGRGACQVEESLEIASASKMPNMEKDLGVRQSILLPEVCPGLLPHRSELYEIDTERDALDFSPWLGARTGSSPQSWYVSKLTGIPASQTTIAEAVNAAASGDSVFVRSPSVMGSF